MDSAGSFLEVAGLLAVLGSAAIVFVTLAQWIAGKRRNEVRLGAEMLVFFSLAYGFHAEILGFLGLARYVTDVAGVVATLWWLSLAFTINTALRKYLWLGLLAKGGESQVPHLLTGFVSAAVYLIAIMAVMHFVYGEPITAIAATSGAAAFVIGYSAQTTLGELFAGVSLNMSGNIKKGDFLEIDGTYGTVHDIDWRSVTIYNYFAEALVIFPNSVLATKPFKNYMQPSRGMRGTTTITVEFTAPPNLVRRALIEALQAARFIQKDPPPFVFPLGPSDFGMQYEVGYCFPSYMEWFESQDEALSAVWSGLRKYGIKPGLNHQFSGPGSQFDENAWPMRHAAREADAVEFLADVAILDGIGADALHKLAAVAVRRDGLLPEMLATAGNVAGKLYIVREGQVDLMLADDDGDLFVASEFRVGDAFGGPAEDQTSADGLAAQFATFSVVLEIAGDGLTQLLRDHPAVAERLKAQAAEHETEFAGRRKAHAYELRRRAREAEKSEIMAGLAGRLGGVFKAGLFNRGAAAKRRDALLEATMAATALVAYADGEIETEERDEVLHTLTDLDLLRGADADDGIGRFDAYAAKMEADMEAGARTVLDEVGKLADDAEAAKLVLDICIAVSAADGEIEEEEEARIADIRAALKLDA